MASYSIVIKPSALKELRDIPGIDRERIAVRISGLANVPRPPGLIRLAGQPAYRLRQGDYRIVYEIDDDARIVRVMRIDHRRDVYR